MPWRLWLFMFAWLEQDQNRPTRNRKETAEKSDLIKRISTHQKTLLRMKQTTNKSHLLSIMTRKWEEEQTSKKTT